MLSLKMKYKIIPRKQLAVYNLHRTCFVLGISSLISSRRRERGAWPPPPLWLPRRPDQPILEISGAFRGSRRKYTSTKFSTKENNIEGGAGNCHHRRKRYFTKPHTLTTVGSVSCGINEPFLSNKSPSPHFPPPRLRPGHSKTLARQEKTSSLKIVFPRDTGGGGGGGEETWP